MGSDRSGTGGTYRAVVPDTLDLAERAGMAVDGLTGIVDPAFNFEPYHCGDLAGRPPSMNHAWGGNCTPKIAEALVLARVVSGNDRRLEVDHAIFEAMLAATEDGLWWVIADEAPWRRETYGEDTLWVSMQARLMLALMARHGVDHDPRWLIAAKELAGGLERVAIADGSQAFFPDDIYFRNGWKRLEPHAAGGSSFAGQWRMGQANVLRALARLHSLTGDDHWLRFAGQLAEPLLDPVLWTEHGRWQGHFHTYTHTAWGLLTYAGHVGDVRLLQFVREFYEFTRGFGIPRIGFFPSVVGEGDHPRPCEGCGIADMVCLAIDLSDVGVGDYWEDVDQYVRNHMVEHQFLNETRLREISDAGVEKAIFPGAMTTENVIKRNIGTFSSASDPTVLYPAWTICCVGNLAVALSRAWESIVRFSGGTARINLLLNRASPWLDVDSYLPYEGKVVLHNKQAQRAHVRFPLWVNRRDVRCEVAGRRRALDWHDRYALVGSIAAGDVITFGFPVAASTEVYDCPGYHDRYTCRLLGNTLVDIQPRADAVAVEQYGQDDGTTANIKRSYPMYQRDAFRPGAAPLRETARPTFAADVRD